MTSTETFRKNWYLTRVTSSRGFRVRITGRWRMTYEDAEGKMEIHGEATLKGRTGFIVWRDGIPNDPRHPRARVVDDITRAFAAAKWRIDFGE